MRHFIGIGHSHLHALTDAWREVEVAQVGAVEYTPICVIDEPFAPAFTFDGTRQKPNLHIVNCITRVTKSGSDVSIFLILGGSEAFRWSLTPGPQPFDVIDPLSEDAALPILPNAQLLPYELVMEFARSSYRFIGDFVNLLRDITDVPIVQVVGPPPPRHLPEMVAQLPDLHAQTADFGVSPLAFRLKIWRLAARALSDVCNELGVGFVDCPPEALDPSGGLRDEMVSDVVHGNIIWGRLQVQRIMALSNPLRELTP